MNGFYNALVPLWWLLCVVIPFQMNGFYNELGGRHCLSD